MSHSGSDRPPTTYLDELLLDLLEVLLDGRWDSRTALMQLAVRRMAHNDQKME